jgi:hypothetical protein
VNVVTISKEEFDKHKPNILVDIKKDESYTSNDEKDTTKPRQTLYVYENMTPEDQLLVSKVQAKVILDVDINPLSKNSEYNDYINNSLIVNYLNEAKKILQSPEFNNSNEAKNLITNLNKMLEVL